MQRRPGLRTNAPPPGVTRDREFWFDPATADAAARFFPTHLRLTDDKWAGQPFVLAPWQAEDIVRPAFGWKRPDGTRRYRRVIVWVARKNGKTELMAGVSHLCLVGDGLRGGQGFAIAKDRNQASIVFDKAARMVAMSPTLSRDLTAYSTSIDCPSLDASFRPLSGNPKGKHGLSMSFLIGDEAHEWTDDRLYTFIHQSSAVRAQPIEFIISTAGEIETFGHELWTECLDIIEGNLEADDTLVVIYAADPEDDWRRESTWLKANPNLGVSVRLEYLRDECEKAKLNPRRENDFKKYHLNIWTEQAERWIPKEAWDACRDEKFPAWNDPEREKRLEGRACWGGIDLGERKDLTCWSLWFEPTADDPKWRTLHRFFFPRDQIGVRGERWRHQFERWDRDRAIIMNPGNTTDYSALLDCVIADRARFRPRIIGVDPWNATHVLNRMQDEGVPVEETVKVPQNFMGLSAASKEFESIALGGAVDHGGHPVMRYCVGNVTTLQDNHGNIKPVKPKGKKTAAIDGVSASVNALACWLARPADEVSFWMTPKAA